MPRWSEHATRRHETGAVDFIFKPIEPHILQSKAGIFFELALQREALRERAEEAPAANRAKDNFLAALSHELRTPLTPVLMTAAALESDLELPAEVRAQLGMMRRNVELEARLIDDLLDITRISRGKLAMARENSDLHALLRHTLEIVRGDGHGQGVLLNLHLEAEHHYSRVDPARIQQVFWNLLKNALKFTKPGGSVSVITRNSEPEEIEIRVQDTGIGISPEALPNIFKAFEQGDVTGQHRYGGLGLGLAISQAIVEIHGGSIRAESAGPDQGATFTVSLGAVAPPLAPETPPANPSIPSRKLQLLVVEDHEETAAVLARLLRRSGHHVTHVSSIQDALATFASEPFDAVITDLGLPDGSGLDLMREINRQRSVPGIALSGYGMDDDLRKTKEAGFFAHLVKPVNFEQLREVLQRIGVSATKVAKNG